MIFKHIDRHPNGTEKEITMIPETGDYLVENMRWKFKMLADGGMLIYKEVGSDRSVKGAFMINSGHAICKAYITFLTEQGLCLT